MYCTLPYQLPIITLICIVCYRINNQFITLYVLHVTVSTANSFISSTTQPSVASSEHKSNVPNVPALETTKIHVEVTTSDIGNTREPGPTKTHVQAKPSSSGKTIVITVFNIRASISVSINTHGIPLKNVDNALRGNKRKPFIDLLINHPICDVLTFT